MLNNNVEEYDVVVVGAGHAGCEAALAAARLGLNTIMFTVSVDSIALMPCNPNVGGSSKGHLVKEIDALGGEMGKNIDKTFIQSKMLNMSKGPAVHSLRAQADKLDYSNTMRRTLEATDNLTIKQGEIIELLVEDGAIKGVKTYTGKIYNTKTVVLATGTYLKSRCITGDISEYTGPNGLKAANYLTDSLKSLGIEMYRFKTGTPARIDKKSIDFSKMEEQFGDERVVPFSFENKAEDIERDQESCWLTYTNEETHKIIMDNIDRSPLFSGTIKGTGPRYCPSIEDKVMRFKDKNRHQVFIEPEGRYTNEMYIGGMSSSLPEDVQIEMYRSVKGLENAKIVRNAYAIEYDCINPLQLKPSLEFKNIKGLFSAGQFNGSSGYEEAAAQGLIAGINAALKLEGKEPLILKRNEAYIGVLIDDLINKGVRDPYRLLTSRAEFRLLLRSDNADLRLRDYGHDVGLIDEERYQRFLDKKKKIEELNLKLQNFRITPTIEVNSYLESIGSAILKDGISLYDLLKRSEINIDNIKHFIDIDYDDEIIEQVVINTKYDGYIKKEEKEALKMLKLESKEIPLNIDYNKIKNIASEARQKLNEVRPTTIGQASRISGVNPADIAVLSVYLKKEYNND